MTEVINLTEKQMIMFKENENLVYYMLKKIAFDYSTDIEQDLIQEGMIALYKSVLSYDVSQGTAFSTYACGSIYNAYLYFLREQEKHTNICFSYDDEKQNINIQNVANNYKEKEELNENLNYFLESLLETADKKERLGIYSIFMKILYDKTQQEVADEKGKSLASVKLSTSFAKKSLKSNSVLKEYLSKSI